MPVPAAEIDDYLRTLGQRLHGPRRLRADLLAEARDSLEDAAAAYERAGLAPVAARRRAVAEFGTPGELVPAYQAELAAAGTRTLALRILVVAIVLLSSADLMWQGAPWTGVRPPAGYLALSASLDLFWIVTGLLAAGAWLGLRYAARHGAPVRLPRLLGRSMAACVGLAAGAGVTLYAWSLVMWDAAVRWPPMLVGMVATGVAFVWLAGAVRGCLAGTR
ncbi:permease prefix domain 1-containing protein [Polymorphospora sp. NPDC050346]|uniref:permease prefix domain 1-containing protein n=1 Tax=Polymorphospora sp. NPDC050346 TaxID=3155780 RepID=UPI0033CF4A61